MRLNVFMLLMLPMIVKATTLELPIKYVYDGDTIMTELTSLPPELKNVSIRILGVDTPELRGKCDSEIKKAQEAKAFVKSLIGTSKTMTLSNMKWDKYGGRIDATVTVNNKVIGDELIKANLARSYNGGAKTSWCK